MALSLTEANERAADAVERVKRRWRGFIPGDLLNVPLSSFFVFHPSETELRRYFNPVYTSLFQGANQLTQSADEFPAPAGFVTPENKPTDRKLHVNIGIDQYDWTALFAHEYIHWLSHCDFYPAFYKSKPPNSPEMVEGFTEYATMKCFIGHTDALSGMDIYIHACLERKVGKLPKVDRSAYADYYMKTKEWVKSGLANEAALLNFMFKGQPPTALPWGMF